MNTDKHGWIAGVCRLPLFVCSLLLGSCNLLPPPQADTVRYFTLGGPAGAADGATVRPVQLAGHLRGRQMAVRVSAHEIAYNDEIRWAEPLDGSITRLLRARVGSVGAGRTVEVRISRCEPVRFEGNSVQLAATYTITAADGTWKSGVFTATPRTWDGKDYGALVGLIQDAVNELGDALVAALGGK